MTDDKQESQKKVDKDISHEETTVMSPRAAGVSKPKPAADTDKEITGKPPVVEPSAAAKVEAKKVKPPSPPAQPLMEETPQKGNKRTVLIIVIVVIVLLCCCVAALVGIYLASSGVFENIINDISAIYLSALPWA